VTGGIYEQEIGCNPYPTLPRNYPFTCEQKCRNSSYPIPYQKDKHFGKEVRLLSNETGNIVKEIQWEIYQNGPVAATHDVYESFRRDDNPHEIYRTPVNESAVSIHTSRVVGWGTENGTDY